MAPSAIGDVRAMLAGKTWAECVAMAERAVRAGNAVEARRAAITEG
jgi:hypothetical protein